MSASLPVVFIMGATASGKTAVAMELVGQIGADIVSVDSAMIYRGMNIGTAKPTAEELKRAPHSLVDILDPVESWSVGEFCEAARVEIAQSHSHGRIPLLTGGTMMYFKALEQGLNELPRASAEVRAEINERAVKHGWPAVHAELAEHDPEAASRIHENDSQRIQRALEVFLVSGTPLSILQAEQSTGLEYPTIKCVLQTSERAELHRRIGQRFDLMMEEGLLEEVGSLFDRVDLHSDLPSIRSVGYRQLWAHLDGQCSLEEAVEKAKTATRQLAKRQMTWLRSMENLHVFEGGDASVAGAIRQLIGDASESCAR
ncbi:MAG: tRNA (adenosine(37)-N6)-dimethylallyltransferase MiaA [Gammaproteobacteria bacterium]